MLYSSYQNSKEKATDYLLKFGTELNSVEKFEIIHETPKGAILKSITKPELTAFAYTNLMCGSIVLASVIKVNFTNDVTKPFVMAVVESVIEYPECVA